jgi:energy-converting hydrogenase B subunit D
VTFLQGALLVILAVTATAVVLRRDPLRQTLVAGIYGLVLGLLFFAFQAPDVALSEIVVASVALPVLILLTLSKLDQIDRAEERDE